MFLIPPSIATAVRRDAATRIFLRAESDRYKPQLKKYAALYNAYVGTDARCALYFPLLQSFLEVEV